MPLRQFRSHSKEPNEAIPPVHRPRRLGPRPFPRLPPRRAADPIPAPATQPTTQGAKRTADELRADVGQANKELREIITSQKVIFDKPTREAAAPKAIPVIKRMLAIFDQLAIVGDEMDKQRAPMARQQFLPLLAIFGDADAEAQLTKTAAGADKPAAIEAKDALFGVQWIRAAGDAAAQTKVLEGLEAIAKEDPENDATAQTVMEVASQGAATPELRQRAEKIITGQLKGEAAKQMADQLQADAKMRDMENKPLVLAGVDPDGKQFTTADWKGKVILVDFWATWCGPCCAELPRVKKIYADLHPKGLEVLGVSCDETGEALKKFLTANPDMPWQQLFDATKPGWHPLATQYGIRGIPTMFLIDKKGILRSIKAREDFETEIPKLLAE